MAKLTDIEGIGRFRAASLEAIGIGTQVQLLAAATLASRQGIAAKAELTMEQVLNWANRADFARVNGITDEYAGILEAAGVESPQLRMSSGKPVTNAVLSRAKV